MATVNEVYKVALENRTAINTMKDLAKETEDFPAAGALQDTDVVRVSRASSSLQTTVADIKAASGGGDLNVNADWNESDPLSDAFILNKPVNLSDFNNDLTTNGDMLKSVYDTNNNGKADDADKLGGEVPNTYDQRSHVADDTIHVTAPQKDALNNANVPSASNPIATMADVGANGEYEFVRRIKKKPGNVLVAIEGGDIISGWWDSTLYIKQAVYNSGDTALIGSYTIIDSIEF